VNNVPVPHIALLLPLSSSVFAQHAEHVKRGFLVADEIANDSLIPIKVYLTSDQPDEVLGVYIEAISLGAKIVVGPLNKNAVSAVAQSGQVSVPTLALSPPDIDIELPPQLYTFGLQIDNEARQIARIAFIEGKRRALVVRGPTTLDKRLCVAFLDRWTEVGGELASQFDYSGDQAHLAKLRLMISSDNIDVVFLGMDNARARIVRPYLDNNVSIFATSQIYSGNQEPLESYALDRIRFVDMPWLLQPDHAAVMIYPVVSFDQRFAEYERFYALGIDAYRLARLILENAIDHNFSLDGVTGEITLEGENQFARKPIQAIFSEGKALLLRDRVR
jgi:uncharacterized protein